MGRTRVYPLQGIVGPGRHLIAGSFITVGSGDPTSRKGNGFTVTRSGAGEYTLTLRDAAQAIDSIILGIGPKTIATELVVTYDVDGVTTTVVPIKVANLSGTLADDAGSEVSFLIVTRDTSVPDAG